MKSQAKEVGRFVKTSAAAKMLGLSRHSIRKAVRTGDLPGMRIGNIFVIDREGVEELLRKRTSEFIPAA